MRGAGCDDVGVDAVDAEPRRLRADAERNRCRLVEAATAMFCERGLEVGVGEIAERAGVGRGTLFRNFPSKDALITAVVVERVRDSAARVRARLDDPDPGLALSQLIDDVFERSQEDRAVFEALDDTWMGHPEIRAAHEEALGVFEQLLVRAQAAGAVRGDVSAVDVLLMVKGVCQAVGCFRQADRELAARQLDLVKAALAAPGTPTAGLRGRAPAVADLGRPGAIPRTKLPRTRAS
jgi:AcrR family transcriptional regulator